jgi:hypothetical protein
MYIGTVAAARLSSNSNEFANVILKQDNVSLEWLEDPLRVSCTQFFIPLSDLSVICSLLWPGEFIVNIVNTISVWLVDYIVPSLSEF